MTPMTHAFESNDDTDSSGSVDSSKSSLLENNDEEFDFIESQWEDDVETGLIIRWPRDRDDDEDNNNNNNNNNSTIAPRKPLHLSTKLSEDRIAPLFDGVQWAGTRVWKAAILGLKYLLEHYGDRRSLLELGCGLGVPGMLWYLLKEEEYEERRRRQQQLENDDTTNGCRVVLTDMPDLLPQLRANVEQNFDDNVNSNNTIRVQALDWSKDGINSLLDEHPQPFDVCLNCDCIYEPLYGKDSWQALADVLSVIAERSPSTLLVTSVERRKGDGLEDFLQRLTSSGKVGPIPRVFRDDDDKHHVIEIYVTQGMQSN